MFADAKWQSAAFRSLLPQRDNVFFRPYPYAVHLVQAGIIVKKMIVVHRLSDKIPGARFHIFVHQPFRIKAFRFPQGTDVLISELRRMAVMPQMVQVLRSPLDIHISGIPVSAHGHALRAPMTPDAQFCVPEPIGIGMSRQRCKSRFKGFHEFASLHRKTAAPKTELRDRMITYLLKSSSMAVRARNSCSTCRTPKATTSS